LSNQGIFFKINKKINDALSDLSVLGEAKLTDRSKAEFCHSVELSAQRAKYTS